MFIFEKMKITHVPGTINTDRMNKIIRNYKEKKTAGSKKNTETDKNQTNMLNQDMNVEEALILIAGMKDERRMEVRQNGTEGRPLGRKVLLLSFRASPIGISSGSRYFFANLSTFFHETFPTTENTTFP